MSHAQAKVWRRLRGVREDFPETFTEGRYRCVIHRDRGRSMKITYNTDRRKVDLHCFDDGCTDAEILDRLGLKFGDLFDDGPPVDGREQVATYPYVDDAGNVLAEKFRYKPKHFRYRRRELETGDWLWMRHPEPYVLYRLPAVLEAVAAGERVYVVGGEKDVEALEPGVVATCGWKPGEDWTRRPTYLEALRDAYVTVVATRTEAGRKHARAIVAALEAAGAAEALLREPASGRDAYDHVQAGYGPDDFTPLDPGEQLAGEVEQLPQVDLGDGAAILDEVETVYRRYVAWSNEHQAVAVTLWTAHTHAADQADTTPYLAIESAEPESGKTRTLEVAELLAARAWMLVEPSEAALFRKIERDKPTLLLDEVDALWGAKADGREGLRAILNAGYRRGAMVPRCVGEGTGMGVQDFPVFGPKMLAGLAGKLPRTITSRSIPIRLRRRAKGEKIDRFRLGRASIELTPLRLRLAAWVQLVTPGLEQAETEVPEPLSDRQADCWEALLAIADTAGGDWPKRARVAAVELHGHDPAADPSHGVLLLGHILEAFMDAQAERLPTAAILRALVDREDAPWAEWWAGDVAKGETKGPAARLAKMLKPYGIAPKVFKVAGEPMRGYALGAFEEAFNRYLPPTPPLDTKPRNPAGQSPYSDVTDSEPVTSPQASDQQGYEVTSGNGEKAPGEVYAKPIGEWAADGRPGLSVDPEVEP
jgi:hypothetical protein